MSIKTWVAGLLLAISMFVGVAGVTGTTAAAKVKYNPKADAIMSVSAFKRMGRVHYHNRVFTYYSPNGSHIFGLGAYTSDGTYTLNGHDKNGYLILANNKKFGTKIKTPLGVGVVHDRGTYGGHYDIVVK
ncbi:hypothetical protein IWT140_00986 [Secundilactobacillus pentosiphilus]|uniref:Extracellular protein n=1 Tax=Secundilactobacillus pentosiphilus TaxID=1714682 RepID=A0A1Z5INP6_9LACO|nr:hypothetical protein [Secundilactobacillus pentosiphilus]GAX03384.1 hypothetical protein IWT140_00986 [Secundilactobacillus pentosiphilus]GAX04791.1 hypothetical protein IWT25_00084 [Secundilactobacillus pentosiphilus]